jgi:hypothetical protein
MAKWKITGWLAGAARVLRADTTSLRELALIAGLDPRTMYIGTCMDGVDVRGQDLRGMIFTDLDRDKVIWDERTRWPDEPGAPAQAHHG